MRTKSETGFTLLEILVALVVLGIALGVLLPILSGVITNRERLTDERTAIALAESKLSAIGIDAPLIDGETDGVFDNGFGWRLLISPYETEDNATQIYTKIASLTIFWPKADGNHTLTVKALRFTGRQ